MKAGDRYVFVTAAGERCEYVVEKFDGDGPGMVVFLRNPKSDGLAQVYVKWLDEGRGSMSSAHWERAAA